MTRAQETFLDENRELVSVSHGQHWTLDAGQSSAPVYNQKSSVNDLGLLDAGGDTVFCTGH